MTPPFTILFADPAVQLHVLGVCIALLLTPLQFLRRRRDLAHRCIGYVWVFAMTLGAASSFWITGLAVIGPFGPIHGLSVYVLWNLVRAIQAARHGQIARHRAILGNIAFWGLGVAGTLTLLPGRRMNMLVFGEHGLIGFVGVICVALITAQALGLLPRRRA